MDGGAWRATFHGDAMSWTQVSDLHFIISILSLKNFLFKMYVKVTQSCPIFCDPMDSSPPGSSVHGILQARILEWVAIPFSRGSS